MSDSSLTPLTSPSAPASTTSRLDRLMLACLALSWLKIGVSHWWPDSLGSVLAGWVWDTVFLVWFGSKAWTGYRRRIPYWTRESWLRYLRLVAMPVVAMTVFLVEVYFFDAKRSWGIWGAPQSALRTVWILIDLALMAFGVIGIVLALDWMARGEPSEQFTRTRWFRSGRGSAIAD